MLYKRRRPVPCSPRYTCSRWRRCFRRRSLSSLDTILQSPPQGSTRRWLRRKRHRCSLQGSLYLEDIQSTLRYPVHLYIDWQSIPSMSLRPLCNQHRIGNLPTHRFRPGRLSWVGMSFEFRHRDSKNLPQNWCNQMLLNFRQSKFDC